MKYCPRCAEEYERFIDECPECGAALVDDMPGAETVKRYQEASNGTEDLTQLDYAKLAREGKLPGGAADSRDVMKENPDEWVLLYLGGEDRGMALIPDLEKARIRSCAVRLTGDEVEKAQTRLKNPGFRLYFGELAAAKIFGKPLVHKSCGGNDAIALFVHVDDYVGAYRKVYGSPPPGTDEFVEDLSDYQGYTGYTGETDAPDADGGE